MSDNVAWSYTAINILRECNRKYYFSKLANHGRKDVLRRKLYDLKNVQNLTMWPGTVVDQFMEKRIIPTITAKQNLDFDLLAEEAVEMAKKQFEYSQSQAYLDPHLSKSGSGAEFCVLNIHELNKPYQEEEVAQAYAVIRETILRLPTIVMPDGMLLIEFLKSCNVLTPNVNNRMAMIEQATIKPQIDLIAMHNWKPVVMDWKVSQSQVSDYSRQLIISGLVVFLNRQDKSDKAAYSYDEIRLYEVNLLKGTVKQHMFTEERANRMIDEIYLTSQDMLLLLKEEPLEIDDFELTDNVSSCTLCNYRSICSYLLLHNNKFDENAYTQYVQDFQFA